MRGQLYKNPNSEHILITDLIESVETVNRRRLVLSELIPKMEKVNQNRYYSKSKL